MEKKDFLELEKAYKKLKTGYPLTQYEKDLLKKYWNFNQIEKRIFANQVNESIDDIETFIEKDIKRY